MICIILKTNPVNHSIGIQSDDDIVVKGHVANGVIINAHEGIIIHGSGATGVKCTAKMGGITLKSDIGSANSPVAAFSAQTSIQAQTVLGHCQLISVTESGPVDATDIRPNCKVIIYEDINIQSKDPSSDVKSQLGLYKCVKMLLDTNLISRALISWVMLDTLCSYFFGNNPPKVRDYPYKFLQWVLDLAPDPSYQQVLLRADNL